VRIARHAIADGRAVFILALKGFASPDLVKEFGGAEAAMGEIGKGIRLLKNARCEEIVFAGAIKRPDFSALQFDMRGASLLPKLLAAAGKGDDALLRVVLGAFEEEGFRVIGADDVLTSLLAPEGAVGAHAPSARDWADIRAAAKAAREIGAADVGQGAIARNGQVIETEKQDGTDAMLRRVRPAGALSGVLVKCRKPQQEKRIDLPTIGAATVRGAAGAGLAGIAIEFEGALIIDRNEVVRVADETGIFVYGLKAAELD
jgi:UDP-2,3-diacylglucosamine hydrolase